MSRYFKDFPVVTYRFGNEEEAVLFDNLTVYVDLIDQIKDNVAFYENYNILDGERPDTVSQKLYGTSDYHWTFYLLNEKTRIYGWPVPYLELEDIAKTYYPNIVIETDKNELYNQFLPGSFVVASNGAIGKIVKTIPELGQIFIKPEEDNTVSFFPRQIDPINGTWDQDDVTVTSSGNSTGLKLTNCATLEDAKSNPPITPDDNEEYFLTIENPPEDVGGGADTFLIRGLLYDESRGWTTPVSYEYLAAHHYETSDGEEIKDIFLPEPGTVSGVNYNFANFASGVYTNQEQLELNQFTKQFLNISGFEKITYLERLLRQNDNLRQIKIFKPSAVDRIVGEFRRLVRG